MTESARIAGTELKPAQRAALAVLESGETAELTRAAYESLTGVSRSQAAYDLADLVEAGILVRTGAGRATRYRLSRPPRAERRRWTEERIRAELTELCTGRASWPSAHEFRDAGRSGLYVAASRYGGIGYWAAELGFGRGAPAAMREARRSPRWARVGTALAAALLLALAAVVAVLALRAQDRSAGGPLRASRPLARGTVPIADEVRWRRLAALRRTSTTPPSARARPHRTQSARSSGRRRHSDLVTRQVNRAPAPAAAASEPTVHVSPTTARAPAGAGPTPLPAPTSAPAAPRPLPAP